MEHQHTKSLSTDSRSKNRIRYASTRDRAKRASADVYRSYKRRTGVVTSAASREERVHHPDASSRAKKKRRKSKTFGEGKEKKTTIVRDDSKKRTDGDDEVVVETDQESDAEELESGESCFASELDLAQDRNASELFGKFYREIWPLTRSLAEMLHHADDIVAILLCYMLSSESDPSAPTKRDDIEHLLSSKSSKDPPPPPPVAAAAAPAAPAAAAPAPAAPTRVAYVANLVTTDVLHLIGVLARDFRHEIHRYVHRAIVPRIVYDLLNPPPPSESDKRQQLPLDVMVVEAAFRALSYVFRYDSELLVEAGAGISSSNSSLEPMRQYYGATLAHRRDYARRLAAETYAPLVRRLRSDSARAKHIRRVIRALAASAAAGSGSAGGSGSDGVVRTVQRARLDAIDGVSLFLSQTSCGVPGRLHSKARGVVSSVLDCLVPQQQGGAKKENKKKKNRSSGQPKVYDQKEQSKLEVVYEVASSYLSMLYRHVREGQNFVVVWNELRRALNSCIEWFTTMESEISAEMKNDCMDGMYFVLELICQCVECLEGALLDNNDEADELSGVLEKVLSIYKQLDWRVQASALHLLCSLWTAKPDHSLFATRFGRFFPSLMKIRGGTSAAAEDSLDPALVLANDLLPHLPWRVAKRSLVPAILTAAAQRSPQDSSLVLLQAVATANLSSLSSEESSTKDDAEEDALFFSHHAQDCIIGVANLRALVNVCLKDVDGLSLSKADIARIGFVARCLPFLSSLVCGVDDEEETDDEQTKSLVVKRIFSWSLSVLKFLGSKDPHHRSSKAKKKKKSATDKDTGTPLSKDIVVTKALVLESLAKIFSSCLDEDMENSATLKALNKAKGHANELLFAHPRSIWSVKAVSAVVKCLGKIRQQLNDSSNEVFELLNPNLKGQSHFLRLHSLVILNTYPRRPFIVDHSDLNLTDDLDEDVHSFRRPGGDDARSSDKSLPPSSSVGGPCDIMETLLKIEAMPVSLSNERRLTGEISRVEVLCRTGRLPIVYAEAVSNHMIGLFHVKYSPVWPAAIRALAAVAIAQETCAWPTLAQKLDEIMQPITSSKNDDGNTALFEGGNRGYEESDNSARREQSSPLSQILHHQELCIAWDESNGANTELFGDGHDSEGGRNVSRHRITDSSIIFENTWKVMESVPQLTARKSKVIVPIFLEFLHYQYYIFHEDDPDARELALHNHIEIDDKDEKSSGRCRWSRKDLGRKSLQKKLTSFLKMFAAINGPQQLYKHKLLFLYFLVTLSNPDESIAQLALTCLMKFQLDYVTPYAKSLSCLLKKKEFRDTLTKLDMSKEEGTVDSHHRDELIPVIVRILFGRFSSRGSGAKSSKDSPAARRAAILSFLTVLGKNQGELDYFIYMMVRAFVPKNVDMTLSDSSRVKELIESTASIYSDELATIHCQRVEGFLNLLSDVITQLGFGVEDYVPIFMSLLLTTCERTEGMRKSTSGMAIADVVDDAAWDEVASDDANTLAWRQRVSTIRSLCFRRISDLVIKFASACDFTSYGDRLWAALEPAIEKLPSSVINAEKPPSLLLLFESVSSHPNLIRLLHQNEQSVEAVFRCIAKTSRHPVVASALSFVEQLLTEGGSIEEGVIHSSVDGAVGWQLVQRHVHLLVRQFTERLESGSPESLHKADGKKESNVAQRELDILCSVSELLVAEETKEEDVKVLENLSSLLIPFLLFERKADEFHQRSVLGILERIIPRIGHDAALSHLQPLAQLLGPNKGNPGVSNLEIRQMIVAVISAIARHEEVATALHSVSKSVDRLCASHPKHIEESNFDEVLPVLNFLGALPEEDGGWTSYIHSKSGSASGAEIKKLTPLVYCCFHMLYDEDGVLSRGALKALKTLVSAAATLGTNEWLQMIETTFISCVRAGLTSHHAGARRAFILLMAEVSRSFASFDNDNLYGDLSILIRDDDPDLDFFLNVTHVQVHRRGRAFDRLRKILNRAEECPFSSHSLSNVLLPLATHPVYECNSKADETYALEAVATVGSIAKNLPWGKYQNALWTALTQLSRKSDQERFIAAMICALMDAFHFEVVVDRVSSGSSTAGDTAGLSTVAAVDAEDSNQAAQEGNSVWKALKKRLIPKIESYLVKEKVERSGAVIKRLRSPIALALVKLYQKLPLHIFEARLPRLLTITCGGLKSRDSSTRGVARETLAKIASAIDVQYLSEIIRELAVALSEGYQLHVRSAALHSVILAVSKVYQRPESPSAAEARQLPFDKCVPAIMDLIQQDIFGSASEIKEAENVQRRLVKEAGGTKSHETLELVSKYILFRPSLAAEADGTGQGDGSPPSAVHAIVSPLLERLRDPEVSTSTIGKAKECLIRVTLGLANNESLAADEVLAFVHASVSPFVLGNAMGDRRRDNDDSADSSDDDDEADPLHVSSTSSKNGTSRNCKKGADKKDSTATKDVFQWHPSSVKAPTTEKTALEEKKREKMELRKVIDGASAPKMTGSSRYDAMVSSAHSGINDQAGASAVHFGLGLLHSCMKKSKLNVHDETTLVMADPYIPMLTRCVRDCNDNKVVLLSLKCLGFLLKMDLPSVQVNAEKLSTYVLKLLTESGSVGDAKNEINQNCFRSLTLLLSISNRDRELKDPLNEKQMQALVGLLLAALSESEQNTATFNLIKAIVSRRFISPDFYDLMEVILKLSVQSQNASVRQKCCQIFMQFLIEYPMSKQRLEDHLKQMILNMKYEYEEGRMSAIGLVGALINKLPTVTIEEHAQLFFLPLVLQLVNDDSKKCRESVADCISSLLKRLSFDTVQTLYEYVIRWSSSDKGAETMPLQRTSAQVFRIFVESRADFFKRGSTAQDLVETIHSSLLQQEVGDIEGTIEWELPYFCLVCLEKLYTYFPSTINSNHELWISIIKCLIHPHAWVKQTSSRILNIYITNLKPKALVSTAKHPPQSFLVAVPGSLYEIARNLCYQLNAEEKEQAEPVTILAIKSLTWVVGTMNDHPELCFKDKEGTRRLPVDGEDENDGDDSARADNDNQDPVLWLMMRLSNIAKARGYRRREAIFKCFAAFASSCDASIIAPHLERMIEPLNRTLTEINSKAEQSSSRRRSQMDSDDSELPKEVLQLLEDKCGTEAFLHALAADKSKARAKREKRKQEAAAEAVHDPQAAAQRKIRKQEHEKRRRKRRVDEKKAMRGVYGKKRRHF